MNTTSTISDPAAWHRVLCHLTEWLALSGDLDTQNPEAAVAQLRHWESEGITHIIDLRDEWSDEGFVAEHSPTMNYTHLGTHDDGGWQEDSWFEKGLAVIEMVKALQGKAVVHCHMGVTRAPPMAYAMLLADGLDHIEALELIRERRPIAGIIYAPAAISHHLRVNGIDGLTATERKVEVHNWLNDNPVDLYWVISRIRESER